MSRTEDSQTENLEIRQAKLQAKAEYARELDEERTSLWSVGKRPEFVLSIRE